MSSQFRPDSSSLVDLKAEVYRKKEEAKRNKARNIYDESVYVPKIRTKILTNETPKNEKEDEDFEKISQVQDTLSKKAALYDHLKTSREDNELLRNRFLVEFKDFEEADEDIVEYTDPLGRSRKVTRGELRILEKEDKSWCESRPPPQNLNEREPDTDEETLKRELLREKWSQEEEENLRKRDVHYGDLLFNEARTHGTGYYGFSREEIERRKEIDALKDFHKETLDAQNESKKSQKAKSRLLAARLKKVRERKRLKMGLPIRPVGMEVEEEREESESEGENAESKLEESIAQSVRAMRDKRDSEDRKRKFVREWDLGKEDYNVMSQEDWVREKRTERHSEFGPSYSSYSKSNKYSSNHHSSSAKRSEYSSSYSDDDLNTSREYQNSSTRSARNIKKNSSSLSLKERIELYSEYTCPSSSKSDRESKGPEIPPPKFNETSKLCIPNIKESFKKGLDEKKKLNQRM
ncbi:coiled-coil domain-containing protein 174 [Lepeophtheirus salmonis]|uniref:coiled-coil domain-containing protein 174 n=1 Tax=Lepeophtheirus salmonis TaxID=72036 RepID=UPI001AE1E69D|nr:coiled-coil domain-containing protein 174-like [Lepeophtheirus salmonis]